MNTKPMDCFGEGPAKSCQGCPYRLGCAQESSWSNLLEEDKQTLEKHGLSPYRHMSLYYRDPADDYIPDDDHESYHPLDDDDVLDASFEPTTDELILDFCLDKLGFLTHEDIQYLDIAKEAITVYNTENHPNRVYIGSVTHLLPDATYFDLYRSGDKLYGLTRFWEIYRNLKAGKATVVSTKEQSLQA